MALPPWLNIGPTDFLRATQSGAAMGQAIAESNLRAWENQQRMQMEQERYKQAMAQRALQQQALQQYRQGQLEARERGLGLQEQGLGLREQGMSLAQQRAADAAERGQSMMDIARERLKLAQDKAESGKDYGNIQVQDVPGVPGAKIAFRPGSPGLHILTPPRTSGGLTSSQAATLMSKIPALSEIDPSITNELSNLRSIAFPKAATKPGAKFRYDRSAGKIVPVEEQTQPDTQDEEEQP